MDNPRIAKIEWARLEGQRPRKAGRNARLDEHGQIVRPPIARITTEDGTSGFGVSRATLEQVEPLVGARLNEAFSFERGAADSWIPLEYPLWDLVGKRMNQPVYQLTAAVTGQTPSSPHRVPCYDTSLYIDDLHLDSDDEAAALIAQEARDGYERGHRAFKIKVGRGARHMSLEEGTRRDVAVVKAVRAAVGPEPRVMLDANNGYNLNLTKRVLAETADARIFWMEEAFHEDPVLYQDLREWLTAQTLDVLIADGEGLASSGLMEWARQGIVDVVQYDIINPGLTRWLEIGRQLDAWGVRTAPHHYGAHYGNYAACHLASAIGGFTFAEWDEATTDGLAAPGYRIETGFVVVPDAPGFGLELDDAVFERAVRADGFVVGV